jgi:ABC-type nitrate/sulfonate/bicarbonate transport system substrate-binding protein
MQTNSLVQPLQRQRRKQAKILAIFMFGLLLSAAQADSQPLIKVPFPYSPINASSLPWMIAKDARLFEKHGLDVDLVYFGASSLILQTMLSGSANLAGFAGPAIISNVLKGGDVITVAALTPMNIPLITKASIDKPEELRGKKIGISRLGAVPHFAIQFILDKFGIKDATILQMGGQPEAAAALRKGIVDGAMVSAPTSFQLVKEGFHELVGTPEYKRLGIKFISQGIAARRSYAAKNRDVTIRLIKGTMEAAKVMSTQEQLAKKILAKYTRQTNAELLERTYKQALETVNRDPTTPREAIASTAGLMADLGLADRAAVSSTPVDAFFDNSYVDEIKQSPFYKELWR